MTKKETPRSRRQRDIKGRLGRLTGPGHRATDSAPVSVFCADDVSPPQGPAPEHQQSAPITRMLRTIARHHEYGTHRLLCEPRARDRVRDLSPEVSLDQVSDRVATLRARVMAMLDDGESIHVCGPMIMEIVALSPSHPFGLEQLARYYHAIGQPTCAKLFERKLANLLPY